MKKLARRVACWTASAALAHGIAAIAQDKPAGYPIARSVAQMLTDGMHSPQMKQRLEADGSQPAERMAPDELKALVAREHAEFEQIVRQINLKLQ